MYRGGADEKWGTRVSFGRGWEVHIGGIEYTYSWGWVGGFDWDDDYEAYSSDGDWLLTAETISHEVGHTLHLHHDGYDDGTTQVEYYEGGGTPPMHWGPIMGWGSDYISHWTKGEYAHSANFKDGVPYAWGDDQQDDLQIITTQNGFGYRVDDHGSDKIGRAHV